MNASSFLAALGAAAAGVGGRLSGTPGLVTTGVGSALTLIGDFITLGMTPAPQLEKLRDLHPELRRIQDEREVERQKKIRASYGP